MRSPQDCQRVKEERAGSEERRNICSSSDFFWVLHIWRKERKRKKEKRYCQSDSHSFHWLISFLIFSYIQFRSTTILSIERSRFGRFHTLPRFDQDGEPHSMANDSWPRSGPFNQVEVSFWLIDFNKRECSRVSIDPNRLGISSLSFSWDPELRPLRGVLGTEDWSSIRFAPLLPNPLFNFKFFEPLLSSCFAPFLSFFLSQLKLKFFEPQTFWWIPQLIFASSTESDCYSCNGGPN